MLHKFKANEKLPRGSYFYIKVGTLFYAGETAETIEVEKAPHQAPQLTSFNKDGSFTDSYRRYQQNRWWWPSRSKGPRGPRLARDQRKDSVPTYAKPRPRPEKIMVNELTGKTAPKLVEEVSQAKQFRRKEQVESACERIKRAYGNLDINVSVHYKEGDPK